MKTYEFNVEIAEAVGSQTFSVVAGSAEEALRKIRAGEGEIISHDVEGSGPKLAYRDTCKRILTRP